MGCRHTEGSLRSEEAVELPRKEREFRPIQHKTRNIVCSRHRSFTLQLHSYHCGNGAQPVSPLQKGQTNVNKEAMYGERDGERIIATQQNTNYTPNRS